MKATLAYNTGGKRFYELSEPLTIGVSDFIGQHDLLEYIPQHIQRCIKPEFQEAYLEQFKEGVWRVCVSDAHTHIERLVFPAVKKDNAEKPYTFLACDIDGKHTYMIYGGDERAIYDDEVYLRHLCRVNHLKWEGLEK